MRSLECGVDFSFTISHVKKDRKADISVTIYLDFSIATNTSRWWYVCFIFVMKVGFRAYQISGSVLDGDVCHGSAKSA